MQAKDRRISDDMVDRKGEVVRKMVWHVGDELDVYVFLHLLLSGRTVCLNDVLHSRGTEQHSDYHGARRAGHKALLIRRPGALGEYERKEDNENLEPVRVIRSLEWVVDEVS